MFPNYLLANKQFYYVIAKITQLPLTMFFSAIVLSAGNLFSFLVSINWTKYTLGAKMTMFCSPHPVGLSTSLSNC